MLEKDSWSHKSDIFDSNSVKEASSLASDSTLASAHGLKSNNRSPNSSEFCGLDPILDKKTGIVDNNSFNYPMGDINHTGNDINYFENAENKDSNDILYCDWDNFEDIDRMFGEDELGWLSTDDTGGSGDVLKSDVEFPCPDPSEVENIAENHDFSNGYSINNSGIINAPIRYKDSSWTPEKSDSCRSSVNGPDVADSKDGFIPQEHVTGPGFNDKIQLGNSKSSHSGTGGSAVTGEHRNQIKQETQSEGKSKEQYLGNFSSSQVSDLPNEVRKLSSGLTSHRAHQSVHVQQEHASAPDSYSYSQNSIAYMHSDKSHLSDPSSVNLTTSFVKSETNDLTSVSPRDSSYGSSQFQYVESSPDPKATSLATCGQRKKLHCRQGSPSSVHGSVKDGSVRVQSSLSNPGMGGKYENQCNAVGVLATPAELGSSNIQESLTRGSDLDNISLEAASFRQLQHVMEQLDLRTKLCIRDSLYRLAHSAERRHSHADLNAGCGEGDAGTKRYTSFMDMETDTNPIDRSVAHLLFHRPSDSSATLAQESFPLKSSSAVHGCVTSPPVLADNKVSEENVSEVEKVSDC